MDVAGHLNCYDQLSMENAWKNKFLVIQFLILKKS